MGFRSCIVRSLGWYALWLLLVGLLYWPGLIILPQQDQAVFMLGRDLAGNDWQWFRDLLSYNRTRLLQPGDFIAFRPLHMAIIGVEDLLLRYNFIAQGLFGCSLFALSASSLFFLTRRMAGTLAGCALTLFWLSQLAGSKILLWQHITPYVLIPAFFSGALLLLDAKPVTTGRSLAAGALVLCAALGHELGFATAGGIALLLLMFPPLGAEIPGRRAYLIFLVPALLAGAMNLLDYAVVHPPPFLIEPDYTITSAKLLGAPMELLNYAAAIGTACFIPSAVHMDMLANGFLVWDFMDESRAALLVGGLLLALLLAGVVARMLLSGRGAGRGRNLPLYVFLIMFLCTFSVCAFRIVSRELDYMYGATYYNALFSYAVCGMLAYLLAATAGRTRVVVCACLGLLAGWHALTLHAYLRQTAPFRAQRAAIVQRAREVIKNDPSACFAGVDTVSAPPLSWEWTPLFSDLACGKRAGNLPLYLADNAGSPALSTLGYTEKFSPYRTLAQSGQSTLFVFDAVPYGHSLEFSLQQSGAIRLLITNASGRSTGFVVEYNLVYTLGNDYQFDISNALTFNAAARPAVYRLRFTDQALLLFVNDQFAAALPHVAHNGELVQVELSAYDRRPMTLTDAKISATLPEGALAVRPVFSNLVPPSP